MTPMATIHSSPTEMKNGAASGGESNCWSAYQRLQFSDCGGAWHFVTCNRQPSSAAGKFMRTSEQTTAAQNSRTNTRPDHPHNHIRLAARCPTPTLAQYGAIAITFHRYEKFERTLDAFTKRHPTPSGQVWPVGLVTGSSWEICC